MDGSQSTKRECLRHSQQNLVLGSAVTNLNKLPVRVTFTHGKQIPKQSGLIKQQHGGFFHYSL